MADYEKLVEKFFQKKENVLGTEELKKILLKEYHTKNKIFEEKQKEKILKLPKLQISENWGKETGIDREELERIVDTATRGQGNAFDKLRIIQEQMSNLSAGKLGKIKNPRRILSQIMLLETMNRMFKSFQPAPAGFINEAFLSVFYGGKQTAAGLANKEKDIGDVTDSDNVPISIKTKGTGGLLVDGSIENLYTSINRSGKVYFDIYEKITSGGAKEKHVGTLKATRFVVDANNINQFLGKEYFDVVDGKLVPKSQFKKAGKEISPEEMVTEGKIEDLYNEIAGSTKEYDEKEMENLLAKYKIKNIEKISKGLEDLLSTIPKKEKERRDILINNISALASAQISQQKLDATSYSGGLEREFAVPETRWRPFARKQKFIEPIEIVFSDVEINKVLEAAVKELDEQIVQIFNNLDGFSQSINAYLTSLAKNRSEQGFKALQYAKQLEPQTQQVIQKTASDNIENE